MKFISFFLLLSISTVAFGTDSRRTITSKWPKTLEAEKRIWKSVERLRENPDFKQTILDKEDARRIKRGKRLDFYKFFQKRAESQTSEPLKSKRKHNKGHGKYKFKKFLKHFKGPFLVEEIDNGKDEVLKLKITDPKGKYIATKVYYRLENLFAERESANAYQENGQVYVDIDITDIPVGEFKAFFRILAEKTKQRGKQKGHSKQSRWNKDHSFLHYGVFERVETPKVFAYFSLESDPNSPWVTINAGETYSEAGEVQKYIYNIFSGETLIDSVESEESYLLYSFKEPGVYELEVIGVDANQNEGVSERQSVEIINSAPTLNYEIIPREGLPGHFTVDFTGTHDKDGQNIIYYRLMLYTGDINDGDWELDIVSEGPIINFAAPESGVEYTQRIIVYDEDYHLTRDSSTFSYNGDISPKYEWHYINQDENIPTFWYIGAGFLDADGIATYHYTATHEDGTTVEFWEDKTEQHNGLELTKPGLWTFELYAVDNLGLKSDVITDTVNVNWKESDLIPVIDGCYQFPSEEDPRIWGVGCGFYDPLGEVVSYHYQATHPDGDVVEGTHGDIRDNELRFTKKGNWTIEAIATDNDGYQSLPHNWVISVDWDIRTRRTL